MPMARRRRRGWSDVDKGLALLAFMAVLLLASLFLFALAGGRLE